MHRTAGSWILVFLLLTAAGCTPRVIVKKNPCDDFEGFRYYRPKPWLLIRPAGEEIETKSGTTRSVTDQFVSMELQYLPDFSEEYAVQIRNGLGTSNVTLEFQDGWNLTKVNQDLDAQFDENVQAVSELVKAVGGLPIKSQGVPDRIPEPLPTLRLPATNVPLGYYESVIGCSPQGKKQMYGWRYVGFAPFNSCPTEMVGGTMAACGEDLAGPVYGLAFQNGVMVFRLLGDLQSVGQDGEYQFLPVEMTPTTTSGVPDESRRKNADNPR